MVASETSGNITRPPNRSVSAPTGIRPSDPTTTGTATTSACWSGLRCRTSLNLGPSGLSSAQAQKFTANPTVARPSIRPGWPGPGRTGTRAAPAPPVVSSLAIAGSAPSSSSVRARRSGRRTFQAWLPAGSAGRDLGPSAQDAQARPGVPRDVVWPYDLKRLGGYIRSLRGSLMLSSARSRLTVAPGDGRDVYPYFLGI